MLNVIELFTCRGGEDKTMTSLGSDDLLRNVYDGFERNRGELSELKHSFQKTKTRLYDRAIEISQDKQSGRLSDVRKLLLPKLIVNTVGHFDNVFKHLDKVFEFQLNEFTLDGLSEEFSALEKARDSLEQLFFKPITKEYIEEERLELGLDLFYKLHRTLTRVLSPLHQDLESLIYPNEKVIKEAGQVLGHYPSAVSSLPKKISIDVLSAMLGEYLSDSTELAQNPYLELTHPLALSYLDNFEATQKEIFDVLKTMDYESIKKQIPLDESEEKFWDLVNNNKGEYTQYLDKTLNELCVDSNKKVYQKVKKLLAYNTLHKIVRLKRQGFDLNKETFMRSIKAKILSSVKAQSKSISQMLNSRNIEDLEYYLNRAILDQELLSSFYDTTVGLSDKDLAKFGDQDKVLVNEALQKAFKDSDRKQFVNLMKRTIYESLKQGAEGADLISFTFLAMRNFLARQIETPGQRGWFAFLPSLNIFNTLLSLDLSSTKDTK